MSDISLDGSNTHAMRCAAGAQKNIPISPVIMAWVAHEAVAEKNRRIATRYDKTVRNYLSMAQLGCIRLFLRKICN